MRKAVKEVLNFSQNNLIKLNHALVTELSGKKSAHLNTELSLHEYWCKVKMSSFFYLGCAHVKACYSSLTSEMDEFSLMCLK